MTFASGKFAKGLCDRCGQEYKLLQLQQEWNGLYVCPECYEPKAPQIEPRYHAADPQALPFTRPARNETPVPVMLDLNPLTVTQGSGVISVYEEAHGRNSGDIVRFRDATGGLGITETNINYTLGYTIAVTDNNNYTFTVNTDLATGTGTIGGGSISAGPVEVTP